MNYNVIIIGTGGREAAIVMALKKSKYNIIITAIGSNKNPTMVYHNVNCFDLKNKEDILKHILKNNVDLVIIGPEKYLEQGLTDDLQKYKIKCIGPTKDLARLETDKNYGRRMLFMIEYSLEYCPSYKLFDVYDEKDILKFLKSINNKFVLKNIGLCGGKGVKVMGYDFNTITEGLQYCKELIETTGKCLIEQKLEGIEFTLMSYTDGKTFRHMPIVHDYKRLLNNNLGPQTGGMGCVINNKSNIIPFNKIKEAEYVNESVIEELQKDCNETYKGIVYGSFMMLNDKTIKVIEYNCRFGDPEAIAVLSLLETDFMDICLGIVNNTLHDIKVKHSDESACVIYVAPQGYPIIKSNKSDTIIIHDMDYDNMIFANTTTTDSNNQFKLLTSRSVAITAKSNNFEAACSRAMELVKRIDGPIYYRNDIGVNFI